MAKAIERREPAHPRVSGENLYRACHLKKRFGSSPRERGKLHNQAPRLIGGGLIPA